MDNEALKKAFKTLHSKITTDVNPDSVIDKLYSKEILSDRDYGNLRQAQRGADRCRELFALLHLSSHPETFIQLREALLDGYPSIVAEIDQQLGLSPKRQPGQTTNGRFLYHA